MNWEAISAIGEIIGAISVVITLFYLAIQLRQNTSQVKHSAVATEIAAYQDMIGRISELNGLRIASSELADLILKGASDLESLSDSERSRYISWNASLIRHGDMAFFLYERGVIDYERAVSSLGPLIAAMDNNGFEYLEFLNSVRGRRA
jgi:hypothetical protein